MRDMNSMGSENPSHGKTCYPALSSSFSEHITVFLVWPSCLCLEAFAYRPRQPGGTQSSRSFSSSGPVGGPPTSGVRPIQTGRPSDPSVPSPSSYGPPPVGTFQRYPTPQFSSTAQAPPPPISAPGQPLFSPPFRPPPGLASRSPVSFRPQSQIPSVPMGSPPHTRNNIPPGMNVPPSSMSGYPSNPTEQHPPVLQASPFGAPKGMAQPLTTPPRFGQQRGYAPSPPVAAPFSVYSREQIHQGVGPSKGSVQDAMADFSSLPVASVPGSGDAGLVPKALPRPLDGDVEPKVFSNLFPMNCNSRYLRLTTSAIPSSQSLVSRWHLSLGVVVCPLAEAPQGEEVPIVNFGSNGIIRCKRCRRRLQMVAENGAATSVFCSMTCLLIT